MHEHNGAMLLQHHIRASRQFSFMKSETKAKAMQHASNNKFRTGVAAANASHNVAALFRRPCVHGRSNTERECAAVHLLSTTTLGYAQRQNPGRIVLVLF
jgi:hypothetical protein